MRGKIRVLVVDDSAVAQAFLARVLTDDAALSVVGTVGSGAEALAFLEKQTVDVVLMDVLMPQMDGYETTRRIMETRPLPIVICSGAVQPQETGGAGAGEAGTVFRLMEAGAVAFVQKPAARSHADFDAGVSRLVQTVKLMSEVKVVRRWGQNRWTGGMSVTAPATPVNGSARPAAANAVGASPGPRGRIEIVGIGASTGGPSVIQTVLASLPRDFSPPLLVVQHIAPGFVNGFADWLSQTTGRAIHIAAHGDLPLPGHVYVAPDDHHMGVQADGLIGLSRDPPENGMRPSVSYLFRSLAKVYGRRAIGVLLTGMGKDGASELKRMKDQGAPTIVQDRETSVVFGMPGEAVSLGAHDHLLAAEKIAPTLAALTHQPQV